MQAMTTYIKIGMVINTHGHKGELKILPLTDDINRFNEAEYFYVQKDNEYIKYHIKQCRIHQAKAVIAFCEIPDMNEAQKLKGKYLELPEAELMPLPDGHYYIYQLVGLDVYEGEQFLGKLNDVLKTGSNDVYVVKGTTGKEMYLPAIKEVVGEIDLAAGVMKVTVPPGLLD